MNLFCEFVVSFYLQFTLADLADLADFFATESAKSARSARKNILCISNCF